MRSLLAIAAVIIAVLIGYGLDRFMCPNGEVIGDEGDGTSSNLSNSVDLR